MPEIPKFDTLVAMLESSRARFADRPLFGVKRGGAWTWITYAEFGAKVDAFRAKLAAMGVGRGDRVAMISNNRLEWVVAAHATFGRAAAFVPMYEAQLDKDWKFILEDSGAKVVLAADKAVKKRVLGFAPELTVMDVATEFAGALEEHLGKDVPTEHPAAGDLAMFIYTSGTTGNPKGVELSHQNIASNAISIVTQFPITPDDRSLSFLPWAHVAGGCAELNGVLSMGASTAICEKVDELVASLAEVRPTFLLAVPRIWNRIYDGVHKNVQSKPKIIQRIFAGGLAARSKQKRGEALGIVERLVLWLATALVFKKVVARFGGRLKYAISGAAALSREVAEFVDNLGIPVFEGYGMTECAGVATLNPMEAPRLGSVGKALPGVRLELDRAASGDGTTGEVIIHGDCVMLGYHGLPEETKAMLTESRGLRSGDLGRIDADGYLFITGRVKEIYKLENGKYVSPVPLEESITLSPFIAQAMVHGQNKPHNVALLVPERANLAAWAKERGLAEDYDKLVASAEVKQLLAAEVAKHSESFKGFERVRDFLVVAEELTVDNDMLTPTLKVKRRNVMTRFGDALEALYAGASPGAD